MEPQVLAIVLLLAGFVLIMAEFFIPSGGTIALLCVGSFAGSFYYAYQAWYHEAPYYWWGYVVTFMILVPGAFWGAFKILTTTRFGDRILLRAPELADVTPYQQEADHLALFIGQRGTTMSLMSPGGMVVVNGERLHASVEGTVLESGTPIIVCGVSGTRVIVRAIEPADEVAEAPEDFATEDAPADEVMDSWENVDPWRDTPESA